MVRADRREDHVAAGQRDEVEGNLLGSRPGARRRARALALCALPDRVAAERPGRVGAHRAACSHCPRPG
jgi:hypothetical protein